MATVARSEPGQRQTRLTCWHQGPSSAAFPGISAVSWIRGRVPGTPAAVHTRDASGISSAYPTVPQHWPLQTRLGGIRGLMQVCSLDPAFWRSDGFPGDLFPLRYIKNIAPVNGTPPQCALPAFLTESSRGPVSLWPAERSLGWTPRSLRSPAFDGACIFASVPCFPLLPWPPPSSPQSSHPMYLSSPDAKGSYLRKENPGNCVL